MGAEGGRPKLHDFQKNLIDRVRKHLSAGAHNVLLQLPTGGGKTVIAAEMVRRARERGKRGMFMVHRDFLVDQAVDTARRFGVRCGVIQAGRLPDLTAPFQVCMTQTLTRRLKGPFLDTLRRHGLPDLIFWDEAHHFAATTCRDIERTLRDEATTAGKRFFNIGLTATPNRLDGKPLDTFEHLVVGPDVGWLIEHRYLAPYQYVKEQTTLGTLRKGLATSMGDYDAHEQQERVKRRVTHIAGETVDLYHQYAPGQRAIFFAVGVDHSKETAERFNKMGIPAEHIDGQTLSHKRGEVIRRFARGETLVLCNVNVISEGFDVPAADCIIMGRHTRSVTMYLQQVGRALRYQEGKEAVIIDQAGNHAECGLPNTPRTWTLKGRKKRKPKPEEERSVRVCSHCGKMVAVSKAVCPNCGEAMRIGTEVLSFNAQFEVVHYSVDSHPTVPSLALPGFKPPPSLPWEAIHRMGDNAKAIGAAFKKAGHPDPDRMGRVWADINKRRVHA